MHEKNRQKILAVCDRTILGKTYKEGKFQLCLKEPFYGNQETSIEDLHLMAESADQINISGEKSISCLKEKQNINDSSIITIEGIPHIQIIKL